MSFTRRRGKKLYLYWNVRVPDPDHPKGYRWEQRSRAVSEDRDTFNEFKTNFDYGRTRSRLGLTNDRKEWAPFMAEFLPTKTGNNRLIYELALKRFEAIVQPVVVSAITYAKAKNWLARLTDPGPAGWKSSRGKPLSAATVSMDLRCLHAVGEEAVRSGYALTNVFKELKPPPTVQRLPRYFTIPQVKKILKEAKKSPARDLHAMVLVLKHTGIRKSELISLRWTSIDTTKGVLYLREGVDFQPKDRAENAIGLHKDVLRALRKLPRTSEYVFPGRDGKKRSRFALGKLFNRLYRRAGVPYTGLHVMRHTFGTHAPLSEKVKQKVMGHSDPRTTRLYSHITPEELRAVKNVNY